MNRTMKFYQDLVELAQEYGWKVKPRKKGLYGASGIAQIDFVDHNHTILIDKDFEYKLGGCYVLAHELGHIFDYEEGKYTEFFNYDGGHALDEDLIFNVEWSAHEYARECFELYGYSTHDRQIFKLEDVKKDLDYWRNLYENRILENE